MSFSINTNITSLQAQQNLAASAAFQAKTINEVTSGLRIVSSGDDAAGLAVANSLRSDQATLTQGIQNANNGLSTLQTIDGGINNISTLLDRASTLAAQSASGTFTGDRSTLNSEYQSVLGEINRQAQAIGLDTGGTFAKALSVFIGGGTAGNGATAVENGTIGVDLSKSAVDGQALGLNGTVASGAVGSDIGNGGATTVTNILSNAANGPNAGTSFVLTGAGFSDSGKQTLAVNLTGVTDTASLLTAINGAIKLATTTSSGASTGTAFANAGITAAINTDSTGKQQLTFSSATAAFQVQAGDQVANALLGNFNPTAANTSTGQALTSTATGGNVSGGVTGNIVLRVQGSGLSAPIDVALTAAAGGATGTAVATYLTGATFAATTQGQALAKAGITVTQGAAGTPACVHQQHRWIDQRLHSRRQCKRSGIWILRLRWYRCHWRHGLRRYQCHGNSNGHRRSCQCRPDIADFPGRRFSDQYLHRPYCHKRKCCGERAGPGSRSYHCHR